MSAQINDGGPAFPVNQGGFGTEAHPITLGSDGMSLLDWFAGQAMAALIADHRLDEDVPFGVLADTAYEYAEAMITSREEYQ